MQDLTPPKLTPMKGALLGRIVGAVTRRPLTVLALTAVLALGGAALALRLEPSVATDTLVDSGSDSFQATERFKRDFGDEAVLVLVRGELTRTVLTQDLGRVLRLEGCLSGNVPEKGLRDLPDVCRELAELKPAKAVYGPGTFINTAATQIAGSSPRRSGRTAGRPSGRRRRPGGCRSDAATRRPSRSASRGPRRRPCAPSSSSRPSNSACATASPTCRASTTRASSRHSSSIHAGRRRRAEVALRLPLPLEERRADPGAHAPRPERGAAPSGDRAHRGGDGRARVPAAAGRALHRDRRAGGDRGPRRRRAELDLRAARRGAAADGGHARARLPLSPAVAAARARTGGRRDDLRRVVARRRQPHDGVDRGPARADRARRRLRDPVPGALRRGATRAPERIPVARRSRRRAPVGRRS